MAESFENLDKILHDWAKDNFKKDRAVSFLEIGSEKNTTQSTVERNY